MDTNTAWRIVEKHEFDDEDLSKEEKEFLYTEALEYLVQESLESLDDEEYEDPELEIRVFNLANYYLDKGLYDLALKYYEFGAERGEPLSLEAAGRIWYSGHSSKGTDYQKAYCYLKQADENDWWNASYLLADMYRYGQFVNKDYSEYKRMIERLSHECHGNENWRNPSAEIQVRLAEIWAEDGQFEAAAVLMCEAESLIKMRISMWESERTPWEDIETLLRIQGFLFGDSPEEFEVSDLLDLYFAERHRLAQAFIFCYDDCEYEIVLQIDEDGAFSVWFEGAWYRSVRDFLDIARIDGIAIRHLVY